MSEMEITNEIKAKVLSEYLPFYIGHVGAVAVIASIEKLLLGENMPVRLSALKPLSAITDAHAEEVGKLLGFKVHLIRNAKAWIKETCAGNGWTFNIHPFRVLEVFQFLKMCGYDLPHRLLGGNTLKEVGLADY